MSSNYSSRTSSNSGGNGPSHHTRTSLGGLNSLHNISMLSSEGDGASLSSSTTQQTATKSILGHQENRNVLRTRRGVLLAMVLSGIVISITSYFILRNKQREQFHYNFQSKSQYIMNSFTSSFLLSEDGRKQDNTVVSTLESFSKMITSHSMTPPKTPADFDSTLSSSSFASSSTSSTSAFPFITIPDFERRVGGKSSFPQQQQQTNQEDGVEGGIGGDDYYTTLSELAQITSTIFVPIVSKDLKEEWETYSVTNQGWYQQSMNVQKQKRFQGIQDADDPHASRTAEDDDSKRISDSIYHLSNTFFDDDSTSYYAPVWQFAPVSNNTPTLVNLNLMSHPVFAPSLEFVIDNHVPLVGKSLDFTSVNEDTGETTVSSPIADIYIPIYDKLFASQYVANDSTNVVGLLICAIYWQSFFTNIIPEVSSSSSTTRTTSESDGRHSIVVVLENSCDQQYSYRVNGPSVKYLGPSDMHDRQYNDMKVSTDPNSFLGKMEENITSVKTDTNCYYSISVYPTTEFEDEYITKSPIYIALSLAAVFVFTSAVFVLYDRFVERRQRVVLSTAKAANDVVGLHFPKHLHKELYNQNSGKKDNNKQKSKKNAPSNSKLGGRTGSNKNNNGNEVKQQISDNFESCTVLFADLIGFLEWSRGRDPAEIFLLLETIFECLDKLTKRHDVFKVETIGDTYLAVTGLPKPQPDHAKRMVKFAYEGCRRVTSLLQDSDIQQRLGTSKLTMRFGLHSGTVMAGVLQGVKTRFQIFGDTVNTAARLKSTGVGGRIHISQETHDYVVSSGKAHWMEARKDKIYAKGKGELSTYWVTNGGD